MTIGFYFHGPIKGRGVRRSVYGPFWCSLRRGLWKFIPGQLVGMPDQLIIKFGAVLRRVLAVGREGTKVVVHVG